MTYGSHPTIYGVDMVTIEGLWSRGQAIRERTGHREKRVCEEKGCDPVASVACTG